MDSINVGFNLIKKTPKYVILFVVALQALTLFLFVCGPRRWYGVNYAVLIFYVAACNICLISGYLFYVKQRNIHNKNVSKFASLLLNGSNENLLKNNKRINILKIMLVLAFFMLLIDLINALKLKEISLKNILDAIYLGITDPKLAYYKPDGIVIGGRVFTHLKTFLAPILWSSIPISIYMFPKLKMRYRFLAIFNIILEACKWIGQGTNKGIFDLVIIFAALLIIKIISANKGQRKKVLLWSCVIVGVMLIVAVTYFTLAIGDRTSNELPTSTEFYFFDTNNFLWKICPKALRTTFDNLLGYLTQGYFGLWLTMQQPPTFMFGIGNSSFLMANFSELFGVDLIKYTLQYQVFIKTGWHYSVKWHSIYSWIANDTTILFVPLVMAGLGFFFAALVDDVINKKSFTAVVLFCLFIIMFCYFSANNQISSYPSTAFCFYIVTFIWLIERRMRYLCEKRIRFLTL